MTKVMEHSDDKLVEYLMIMAWSNVMKMAWGIVMKKAWSLFVTGFKEHSDDKCQESL